MRMYARAIAVVLIFLSLVSPWASNWEMEGHWFLFGYHIPILGFRVFRGLNVVLLFPLLFMIIGLFCSLLCPAMDMLKRGILGVLGSTSVVLAIHFFLQIYQPDVLPLPFEASPSVGITFGLLGAFLLLATGIDDLLIWNGGFDT